MGERKRKSYAARPEEEGRHAVSNINRVVRMKIATEDTKRCSIPTKRERLKTVSPRRGVDETKSFSFHPI